MTTNQIQLTPLALEARSALPTTEAARHLGRAEQTMRIWACRETGPLRPIRVNGRLAWPVAEIKRLLGVETQVPPNFAGYVTSTGAIACAKQGGAV